MEVRIAWLELLHNKRFSVLFIVNLMIGLTGFVALDGFKSSFEAQLQTSSKNLLSSDITITSRQGFTGADRNTIRGVVGSAPVSEISKLFSMAKSPTHTGLVEIKAIDDVYPIYGSIQLKERTISSGSSHQLNRTPRIWVVPEILVQFNLEVGDSLQLGGQNFIIEDLILDDSSMSWSGAAYAPRLYMGSALLEKTGLLQEGSTVRRTLHIKAATGDDVEDLEQQLFDSLDNSIRVKSYYKAGQDSGRLLKYLTDYLGLVSLVALFLSGLGTFYLFRTYLAKKQKDIAILLTLGMDGRKATLIYLLQLGILGTISTLGSILISVSLLPMTTQLLAEFSPINIQIMIGMQTLVAALALGIFTPVLLCLPLLLEVSHVKPAELFQEFYTPRFQLSTRRLLGFFPAVLGIYGLSILQSHSLQIGSLFFGALTLTGGLTIALGFTLIRLTSAWSWVSPSWKLAQRYLSGNAGSSISCFLALSLCSLLINLIPQVEATLLTEIQSPKGEQLPSLFLFDIQENQTAGLSKILTENDVPLNFLSPMVRGRLTKVNGLAFTKGDNKTKFSREDEREQRFRNRGVNLSYRDSLSPSETIIMGRSFSAPYSQGMAEVSLEKRYGERLGIQLNDVLTFEVQGLDIEGRVVNFRKVKWNSFQPNFFITFQEGVINDAPKTFLAAIPPLASLQQKNQLQRMIVQQYPNISVLDVSKLVEKLGNTISQMALVLTIMATLSVFAGLIVTFSISSHQVQQRVWDINLLKVLGASFNFIRSTVLKEFFALSLASTLVGAIASLMISKLLVEIVFDGLWSPDLLQLVSTLLIIMGLCLVTSILASQRVLTTKPQLYL